MTKWVLIIIAISMAIFLRLLQDAHEAEQFNPQPFRPCVMNPNTGEPMYTPCDEH